MAYLAFLFIARTLENTVLKYMRRTALLGGILALLASTSVSAPTCAQVAPFLSVDGEVSTPLTFTESDFRALPRVSVTVKDATGASHVYEGVDLAVILVKAGVPLKEQLKGADIAKYLQAQGADGFIAVFALPEFDSQTFVVADALDGKPLPAEAGPLITISAAEQRHSRWVKHLSTLRIVKAQL